MIYLSCQRRKELISFLNREWMFGVNPKKEIKGQFGDSIRRDFALRRKGLGLMSMN